MGQNSFHYINCVEPRRLFPPALNPSTENAIAAHLFNGHPRTTVSVSNFIASIEHAMILRDLVPSVWAYATYFPNTSERLLPQFDFGR
jgi:hypothetical protein